MVLMGINPHRLADRIIANIPAFDISHNKAEFSSLSLVCKPPPLFRGEARVLVWGERWCCNPSGSRPNFFGRQHLTFDKGGKDMVRGKG